MFYVLNLLLFYSLNLFASGPCDQIFVNPLTHYTNFPINKHYPSIKIHGREIPYGSKAFILWRSRSSPSIPDSMFRYHYMKDEQILIELGFAVTPKDVAEHTINGLHIGKDVKGASLVLVMDEIKNLKRVWGVNLKFVLPLIHKKFSSPEDMFNKLGISPTLSKKKFEQTKEQHKTQQARYIIDGDGTVYFWTDAEAIKIKEATGLDASHANFYSSINPANTKIIQRKSLGEFTAGYYIDRGVVNFNQDGTYTFESQEPAPFSKYQEYLDNYLEELE
jgi:hypothetical protein